MSQLVDTCRITVTDEAGELIRKCSVSPTGNPAFHRAASVGGRTTKEWSDAESGVVYCTSMHEGTWAVLTARGIAADVTVSAPGYRPQVIEGARGNVQVRLQKALGLTLRATGTTPLVMGDHAAQLLLKPIQSQEVDASPWNSYAWSPRFDAQRRVHVKLPGPGRYSVFWITPGMPTGPPELLESKLFALKDSRIEFLYEQLAGGLLEIREEDAGAVIDIAPPADLWEGR